MDQKEWKPQKEQEFGWLLRARGWRPLAVYKWTPDASVTGMKWFDQRFPNEGPLDTMAAYERETARAKAAPAEYVIGATMEQVGELPKLGAPVTARRPTHGRPGRRRGKTA